LLGYLNIIAYFCSGKQSLSPLLFPLQAEAGVSFDNPWKAFIGGAVHLIFFSLYLVPVSWGLLEKQPDL
jgi:hypothetical protein